MRYSNLDYADRWIKVATERIECTLDEMLNRAADSMRKGYMCQADYEAIEMRINDMKGEIL